MMVSWFLLSACVGIYFPDPTPDAQIQTHIDQLSKPRLSQRTAAADALIKIGDPARPALLRLLDSTNLEQRSTAARVLDRIEGRELTEPKLITLDFRNRPLKEVVDAIADRAEAGLILQIGNDPKRNDEPITLVAEEKVSFWDAVERLEKLAKLQIDPNNGNNFNRNAMIMGNINGNRRWRPSYSPRDIVLNAQTGMNNSPRCRSGRFEMLISNLHLQRDRILGASDGHPPHGSLTSKFEARMHVLPEPNITIGRVGEVKVTEAFDDRKQSLIADVQAPEQNANGTTGFAYAMRSSNLTDVSVALRYPDQPGRVIRVLRGEIELNIIGSKREGVTASLISAFNTPVFQNDLSLTVHEVKAAVPGRTKLVDITLVRPEGLSQVNNGMGSLHRTANSAPPGVQGWLLFLDAKGRCVDRVAATPFNMVDSQRRTIQFNQPVGADPIVAMQYLSPTWTTVRVPFEFRDITMP